MFFFAPNVIVNVVCFLGFLGGKNFDFLSFFFGGGAGDGRTLFFSFLATCLFLEFEKCLFVGWCTVDASEILHWHVWNPFKEWGVKVIISTGVPDSFPVVGLLWIPIQSKPWEPSFQVWVCPSIRRVILKVCFPGRDTWRIHETVFFQAATHQAWFFWCFFSFSKIWSSYNMQEEQRFLDSFMEWWIFVKRCWESWVVAVNILQDPRS